MTVRVLIIDDDETLSAMLEEYLSGHGLEVTSRPRADLGLEAVAAGGFDAVILDVMLPDLDGFEVCRRIRERSAVPIVMLTARGDETDRIVGLEIGADDYLAKPFHAQELLARVEALSRRGPLAPTEGPEAPMEVDGLSLDGRARTVHVDGREVHLTGAEFDILRTLVERAGRVVSRERLMELARGEEFGAFDRAIDVHISNIRKKLGDSARAPRWIRTIRGVGYQVPMARERS